MERTEFFKNAIELVECCEILYLATFNHTLNAPETRAMANLRCLKKYPDNKSLFKPDDLSNYIVTGMCTDKSKELKNGDMMSLYYYCEKQHSTLTLFGVAELIEDMELKSRLWSDSWRMFFPEGKEDDSYALFKIVPKTAKYYDMKFDKIIMNL